jgi:hypothetical protein
MKTLYPIFASLLFLIPFSPVGGYLWQQSQTQGAQLLQQTQEAGQQGWGQLSSVPQQLEVVGRTLSASRTSWPGEWRPVASPRAEPTRGAAVPQCRRRPSPAYCSNATTISHHGKTTTEPSGSGGSALAAARDQLAVEPVCEALFATDAPMSRAPVAIAGHQRREPRHPEPMAHPQYTYRRRAHRQIATRTTAGEGKAFPFVNG